LLSRKHQARTHGVAGAYIDSEVQVGDILDASAPRGGFTLRPGDEPAILLSAGIGATADRLNQFMGKPRYKAAREVTCTLAKRLYGTHQETSLAKGIQAKFRLFAEEFSQYLIRAGILEKVVRSKHGNIGS